jgi:hypothetical protein
LIKKVNNQKILITLFFVTLLSTIGATIKLQAMQLNTQPALSTERKYTKVLSKTIEKDNILVEKYDNGTVRSTDIYTNQVLESINGGKPREYIEKKTHYILSGNKKYLCKIYKINREIKILNLETQLEVGYLRNVRSYKLSPEKNIFIVSNSDGQNREFINVISFKGSDERPNICSITNRFPNELLTIKFLNDETYVLINFSHKSIMLFDTQENKLILDINDNIFNYKISENDRFVFISYNHYTPGDIKNIGEIYDLSYKTNEISIKPIKKYKRTFNYKPSLNNNSSKDMPNEFMLDINNLPYKFSSGSYYYDVFRCEFDSNNRCAFIYNGDELIEIIDINKKESIAKDVKFFKFSLNNKLLFLSCDNFVQVINIGKKYKVKQYTLHETETFNCKFSDDEYFILLFRGASATLYETRKNIIVEKFENIDFNESIFSPDSKFLYLKHNNINCDNKLNSGQYEIYDLRKKIPLINQPPKEYDLSNLKEAPQNNQVLSDEQLNSRLKYLEFCYIIENLQDKKCEETENSENALMVNDSYFVNQVIPTDNQEFKKEEPFFIESIDPTSSMEVEQFDSEEIDPEKMDLEEN